MTRRFTCSVCGKRFTRVDNLKQHAITMHGAEPCETDKRGALSLNAMGARRMKRNNLASLACRMCGIVVKGRYSLKRHELRKHNIPMPPQPSLN